MAAKPRLPRPPLTWCCSVLCASMTTTYCGAGQARGNNQQQPRMGTGLQPVNSWRQPLRLTPTSFLLPLGSPLAPLPSAPSTQHPADLRQRPVHIVGTQELTQLDLYRVRQRHACGADISMGMVSAGRGRHLLGQMSNVCSITASRGVQPCMSATPCIFSAASQQQKHSRLPSATRTYGPLGVDIGDALRRLLARHGCQPAPPQH